MSVNLGTTYLGLQLKNPLLIAGCSLTGDVSGLRRLEDAGAAAIVLPSLFEEQIVHEDIQISQVQDFGTESFAESLTYFPELTDYHHGPDSYLETITAAKSAVSIPVIASLNGSSEGGWTRYAKLMEDAGADALELNVYFIAADVEMTSEQVESQYLALVRRVKQSVSIPLAVKIGSNFSALPNMAKRLVEAGADGLVLFNRYLHPDFDLERLETEPKFCLSNPDDLRERLRWIAILRNRIPASLAATGGIHCGGGLLKALLAGADVGTVASVLYKEGIEQVGKILDRLTELMEQKEYESVEQLQGSMSREKCPDPAAFARGNYMKALSSFPSQPI
ncbi:MAG: dihydroorotate dehydrogenase-like protein [Pirellulales bacterium]|nr:dihydroorotate dehydrogenase-like protein [Pirellulales bacterium]